MPVLAGERPRVGGELEAVLTVVFDDAVGVEASVGDVGGASILFENAADGTGDGELSGEEPDMRGAKDCTVLVGSDTGW